MRLVGRQKTLARELLRDRAAALGDAAVPNVGQSRRRHTDEVEALVLIEALILDGDDGLNEVRRDLGQRDVDPLFLVDRECRLVVLRRGRSSPDPSGRCGRWPLHRGGHCAGSTRTTIRRQGKRRRSARESRQARAPVGDALSAPCAIGVRAGQDAGERLTVTPSGVRLCNSCATRGYAGFVAFSLRKASLSMRNKGRRCSDPCTVHCRASGHHSSCASRRRDAACRRTARSRPRSCRQSSRFNSSGSAATAFSRLSNHRSVVTSGRLVRLGIGSATGETRTCTVSGSS